MRIVTRRNFLKLGGGLGLATGLTGFSGIFYSAGIEPNDISLEKKTIHLARLPARFDGFTIALLSDLHLYPFTTVELIEKAINLVNAAEPDLVALAGDFVYTSAGAAFELIPLLERLNPRRGVFGVLGNHDHRIGPKVVSEALVRGGVELLTNRGVEIQIGSDSIYLAGIDSFVSGVPRPFEAFSARRGDLCSVTVLHEPDPIAKLSDKLPIDLQLSGHSHGGQVRLPFLGPVVLPRLGEIYNLGLYQVGSAQVYTSRGIGMVGLPLRFNCPPEVTAITLSASKEPA
jgi:predicted MPP superfamily phosphohydrolase